MQYAILHLSAQYAGHQHVQCKYGTASFLFNTLDKQLCNMITARATCGDIELWHAIINSYSTHIALSDVQKQKKRDHRHDHHLINH